jgi:hypothetical protein
VRSIHIHLAVPPGAAQNPCDRNIASGVERVVPPDQQVKGALAGRLELGAILGRQEAIVSGAFQAGADFSDPFLPGKIDSGLLQREDNGPIRPRCAHPDPIRAGSTGQGADNEIILVPGLAGG